nr:hypothetical protein B0A51_09000 [Rachicladosporium sp. CCFEE 5018]
MADDTGSNGQAANSSSDFVRKLYKMLESPQDERVVRWGNEGDSFVVLENEKFTKHILPKHFKHSNFASFVRQLNKYDFHKVRHSNEEGGASPYGVGAWEFKHPDFKMNNKDALDNIRRKAPAPRKANVMAEDILPTQQMDLFNTQLVATQQQLQQLQERYNDLTMHNSMLLQELIGVQKTVVNHEHVMQYVMNFLTSMDAQRRRESRVANPFAPVNKNGNGLLDTSNDSSAIPSSDDDVPASPLQHATKLLSEVNADHLLNSNKLEQLNEQHLRMNASINTPPPINGTRSSSRGPAPHSATSSTSIGYGELENMVYPIGHTNGIDPMYSEHVNNIPYAQPPPKHELMPGQPEGRKKSTIIDPGWVRQPQILLVEDDQTCRRIGGKFLYAFHCSIDSALDGLEAVNKLNTGAKYDMILMDIIMPNLDGVSATHLIRQFDNTPIIAMTSNIRSDDIAMYFQHGMNDVLPKPFTKEGLLSMLEKHLGHLKKHPPGIEIHGSAPQSAISSKRSFRATEDSPVTSPATGSNWNSPGGNLTGVSPASNNQDDPYLQAVHNNATAFVSQPGASMPPPSAGGLYNSQSTTIPGMRPGAGPGPHRRGISDISGGPPDVSDAKRVQTYAQGQLPPMQGVMAQQPAASKKAGNATEKSKIASEDQRVEILQALVITDDFTSTFTPLTLTTPRCLLPLASTPLLHYTLTFLAHAGVEKVFLLCPANHAAQIESYLQTSKWTSPTSPFALQILRSQGKSVGDVMRDVDQQGALVGDFLCVYGDLIANLNLTAALQAHKARRAKSKNAIMTMVLRQGGRRSQSAKSRPVFVLDDITHRCLHHETLSPSQPHARLQLDSDILSDFPELDIGADLVDCGIDICSPEVLSQWSDNFDWQHPRKGFLYGTLKDFELNGMTVHAHIVDKGYAARVRSLAAYDAVSRDVVGRWTYPFCPDGNLVEDQSFVLGKGGNYREEGVVLARSVTMKRRSVLGKGTAVGHGSVITDSVIGRRCHIGRRVKLEGAYVWDDAWIGDGTTIERAIVANEVSVGHECKILPGAVLAQGTVIANGTTIHGTQRITRHKRKREQGSEEVIRGATDAAVVGQGGEGFDLTPSSDDEDSESLVPALSALDTADTASVSTLDSEAGDSDSDLSALETHAQRSGRTESFGSIGSVNSEETAGEAEARRNAADFHHEAASSIFDSLQRGEDADNIQLELKALTLSSNADGKQVRRAVAVALMKRIAALVESGVSPQKAVNQTLKPAKLLVERAVLDRDTEVKAETVEFLMFVQGDLVHRAQGGKVLLFVCNALVAGESIESEGLDQWLEDERSGATEELVKVRQETMDIVGGDSIRSFRCPPPRSTPVCLRDPAETATSATTPPATRATKRKLDSSADLDPQQPKRKASRTVATSAAASKAKVIGDSSDLPATPLSVSELGAMDSDMDDAASLTSSADFGEAEGSSLGGADDSDVEIDDDFGDDDAFQTHEKDLRAKRKAFEVEYSVYSPEDIQAQQDRQVDEVAGLLEQPKESTAILLRYMRWNKERLIEQYMDKQEEMLDKAGLSEGMKSSPPRIEVKNDFMCEICCEDGPGLQTFAMKLELSNTKSLDLLVTADLTDRYHQLLMRTYVDDKENLKWCPAPNCVFAVECGVKKRELGQIVPTVTCGCKHSFCFGCTLTDHQPCPCSLVKRWMKKCEDDSETANWISANTKECPKCVSTIEKNGGCNHMTCRKCKHEFCWMCMGVWSEHGTSWYNCNRFEEKSGVGARDAQAKSRQSLERYLHYYNRYANHEQSAKLDKDIYHKTEKKMSLLQSASNMSWIEVQFLESASKALQQCRQTLKWTYAFAYYLARNNQTEIFEDNQKDLEMAVENLSKMFEKPTDQLAGLRTVMLDKTTYCNGRRIILLDDTAKNLKLGNWDFNVDLA